MFLKIILLEESWSEIFLLCALQWSLPLEVNPFLASANIGDTSGNENATTANRASLLRPVNELFSKFKQLNVDAAEFAFLKAIVLFKSGKLRKLTLIYKQVVIDFI